MNHKAALTIVGLDKTVWGARIIKAFESNGFTADDRKLSRSWQTCACGALGDRIERTTLNGIPTDKRLYNLGSDFARAVSDNNITKAARLLMVIEGRADKLKACGCPVETYEVNQ